jgi:signal transduction histidine kinase
VAAYLDRIRKLSALLFAVSVFFILAVIAVPSALPIQHAPVYLVLASALVTGAAVYKFPWHRYHPNWFLVIGTTASVMVAILVAFTGGRASIFYPIFVFIVVASGAYYGARPLVLVTTIASGASLSFVLYQTPTREDLLRTAFEIATYCAVAFVCHVIFRGLERSTSAAQRYAATLAVLHDLDMEVITGAAPDAFARTVLARLADVVPFEAGWAGDVRADGRVVSWLAAAGAVDGRALATRLLDAEWDLLLATRKGPIVGDGAGDPFGVGGPNWLVQGLLVAEVPSGVMVLRRPADWPWTDEERTAVAALASQTAVGLEHTRWAAQAARAEARQEVAHMREEFVAQVSHELRGPLTLLAGGTELLDEDLLGPEEARATIHRMRGATERVQALIDDLLGLAAAERAGWTLERRPTDLGALLREAIESVLGGRGGRVTIHAPPDLGTISVDPARLLQVFVNLIGNAVKYSADGSVVLVRCESGPDAVTVRVVDEGIGIPPAALGRVFEKFYRAPNELGRGIPGTGLGLAITKELVEAHGGRLWAESLGVGCGSTFVVVLPRHRRVEVV